MLQFTAKSSAADLERLGPSLMVRVGFDATFDWRCLGTMPTVPATPRRALIDTGAAHNAIDETLARDLSLPIIGATTQAGIGGSAEFQICRAHIVISHFSISIERHLMIADLRSTEGGPCLIFGRSMLRDFRFVYEGDGNILLTPLTRETS